jgi:hypothetical protein
MFIISDSVPSLPSSPNVDPEFRLAVFRNGYQIGTHSRVTYFNRNRFAQVGKFGDLYYLAIARVWDRMIVLATTRASS